MKWMPLALVFCSLASCMNTSNLSSNPDRMKLYTNEDTMKAEVLKFVSVGMPIDEAQAVMEKKGFKCHYGREWFHGEPAQSVFGLICLATTPESSWVFSDEIMVI